MTTIYLVRHSHPIFINSSEEYQIQNEKFPLSIEGEELAKEASLKDEFHDVDIVITSSYVRSMATAKYFARRAGVEPIVMVNFGERKFGVDHYKKIPEDFYLQQLRDENYKIGNGESQKEVKKRMTDALYEVLDTYPDKRIVIVSHSTAGYYLLSNWCDGNKDSYELKYNGKIVVNDRMQYCEAVKLEFDGKKLISICKVD